MLMTIDFEQVSCDFCGSGAFEHVLDGVDWEYGLTDKLSVVRCAKCGLVQLNPRPTQDSTAAIYPSDYGFYQGKCAPRIFSLSRFRSWAEDILKPPANGPRYPFLDGFAPGSILDVGCATGSSVYPYGESGSLVDLRRKGWNVHGCDIDPAAVAIGREMGIDVKVGAITDQTFPAGTFDLVRFNHALEHSRSPINDLTAARSLLKTGGTLIVSVPNISSAAFALFGRYWSGLDLPRHFYHFSPETLNNYRVKLGFETTAERFASFPGDFEHSLKHFLQSDAVLDVSTTCAEYNAMARVNTVSLRKSLEPIIDFLDTGKLGDGYTLIAAR